MEVGSGLASIIVAVVTGAALFAGQQLARRGVKEQTQQQAVAALMAAMEKRTDRAEMAEQRERERADREHERAEKAEDECDDLRRTHRRDFEQLEARCRAAFASLTDIVHTLQGVVIDEVATVAADISLADVEPHPHDEEED